MKSFKSYISEEVLPTANVENGNFDIENEAVRSQVNGTLAAVTAQPAVTPYVLLRKVSKALSYFHIILPKRTFLEGTKGVEVYEVMQFGDRMGMTDAGEFVTHVPAKFYLFFQYGIAHPFNVTYTKPNIDGMYRGMAKIVDQAELDRLLNAAEAMMAESCGCDDKATMSQRKAGREEIQTNGNHGSPSTDKAMDTSDEKSAKVDKVWPAVVKEAMSRKQKDMAVRRFMSHDPDAGERILAMGKKEREEKKSFASAKKEIKRLKEEQIDEVSKGAAISAYRGKEAQERDTHKLHGLIKRKFGKETAKHAERAGAADTGNLFRRGESHGVDRLASAKSSSEMRKTKSGKIHGQDVASKKSEIKFRKSMSKFDKKGHLPEETQIDELKKSTLGSYIKKAHVSGLEAASKGEIAYARKDKEGLRAANKTGEKREQGIERAANKLAKEETQIDELKKSTYASYIKKSAKSQSDLSFDHGEDEHRQYGDRGEDPHRDREVDDRERKISNREKGINRASDKLAKEEYEKVEAGVKKRPGETHTLHRRNPGHKTEYHTITTDRDGRKSVKTGSPKYIKKHWDKLEEEKKPKPVNLTPRQQQDKTIPSSVASYAEKIYRARMKQLRAPRTDYSKNVSEDNLDEGMAPIKKSYAMRKMKKKVSTQVKQGLGVGKEKTNTVLVTNKGDPKAAGGGGVHRIPRDKYDPTKHNLASE